MGFAPTGFPPALSTYCVCRGQLTSADVASSQQHWIFLTPRTDRGRAEVISDGKSPGQDLLHLHTSTARGCQAFTLPEGVAVRAEPARPGAVLASGSLCLSTPRSALFLGYLWAVPGVVTGELPQVSCSLAMNSELHKHKSTSTAKKRLKSLQRKAASLGCLGDTSLSTP